MSRPSGIVGLSFFSFVQNRICVSPNHTAYAFVFLTLSLTFINHHLSLRLLNSILISIAIRPPCSALIWAFVKEAGMHLMKGGSLTKIAMPVGLSQPNTFLQHIACEYACAPLYLGAAAAAGANGDFVERMIQVAAYVVSGLYRCVCFSGIWLDCL